jgi:hypothetical protein
LNASDPHDLMSIHLHSFWIKKYIVQYIRQVYLHLLSMKTSNNNPISFFRPDLSHISMRVDIHFPDIRKTLIRPHHFTRRGGVVPLKLIHVPSQGSDQTYCGCYGYPFCLFLRIFNLILELFRQCDIFLFFILPQHCLYISA